MTVREVARALGISKSEAGRLRIKAEGSGLIALSDEAGTVEQEAGETTRQLNETCKRYHSGEFSVFD